MRAAAFSLTVLAALTFALPAGADDPPDPNATEMAEFFSSFCLQKFPDDSALDELAKNTHAVALRADEVTRYLHQDPGRGWSLKTPLAAYIVTIEAPPYHACAVRRMTPSGLRTAKPYMSAVSAFVSGRQVKVSNMPPSKQSTPSGLDISAYGFILSDATGKPIENLFLMLTNYLGRAPEDMRAAAAGGVGVEVRMVRQFRPQ